MLHELRNFHILLQVCLHLLQVDPYEGCVVFRLMTGGLGGFQLVSHVIYVNVGRQMVGLGAGVNLYENSY